MNQQFHSWPYIQKKTDKSKQNLLKTVIQKDAYTPVLILVLFTIPTIWNQPQCPSTDKWMKKMCFMYTMKYYYSVLKMNELLTFKEMWTNLENIMLSEISKTEIQILQDTTYMWNLKKMK